MSSTTSFGHSMIINQIQFLHKLKESGFSEKQAETLTEAIATDVVSGLATKGDISLLKKDLEVTSATLRSEMQVMEHRLYWKIMAGMAILMTIMPAFTKYLANFLMN